MATCIRPEISEKREYWINKHRHYELKHFCLQYPIWKQAYLDLGGGDIGAFTMERMPSSTSPSDRTARRAILRTGYAEKIHLLEKTAREADEYLSCYLLKAVTEGLSYTYLKTKLEIPCSRDMYYDRYRRFFWLLSNSRD